MEQNIKSTPAPASFRSTGAPQLEQACAADETDAPQFDNLIDNNENSLYYVSLKYYEWSANSSL